MTQKEITLCGKTVRIAYCYGTEIAFHKYAGTSIDNMDATNPEHPLYIVLAAVVTYYQSKGEESPLTDRDLLFNAKPEDLIDAFKEVLQLRIEWYKRPEGEKEPDKKEADPKNG